MSARSTESATRPKRSKLEKEQKRIAKLVRTKRILWTTLAGGLLASFIFLIATSTTAWATLSMPHAVYRNATGAYVLQQYSGLWRNCWRELYNSTQQHLEREYCRMRKFFPSKETVETDDEIDYGILDYSRSEAAFAVISLVLSSLPNFFTWYSIEEPRYTFKRLAGGLHLITAGCIVVCIEVFKSSLEYEKKNLPARFPAGASVTYGYSNNLAWISFALFVLASITMFVMSHKRKGEKARTNLEAMENEPIIIGRI